MKVEVRPTARTAMPVTKTSTAMILKVNAAAVASMIDIQDILTEPPTSKGQLHGVRIVVAIPPFSHIGRFGANLRSELKVIGTRRQNVKQSFTFRLDTERPRNRMTDARLVTYALG